MERERNSRGSKRPRKKVCMFCADRVEGSITRILQDSESA